MKRTQGKLSRDEKEVLKRLREKLHPQREMDQVRSEDKQKDLGLVQSRQPGK